MASARLGTRTPHAGRMLTLAAMVVLAGCSTKPVEDKVVYKSATNVSSLELPPPVSETRGEELAQAKTASGLAEVRATPRTRDVLPDNADAKLQRVGNQRWLVVKASPDLAWDVASRFWTQMGYPIAVKEPVNGVMETDWLETRASVPSDFVRRTLGNYTDIFLNPYKRDKFRTRIEPGSTLGTVEVYVSHQGSEQVPTKASLRSPTATGPGQDGLVWTPVHANAEAEAEMLARLALAFGKPVADAQLASTAPQTRPVARTRLDRDESGGETLVVDDLFDRAWRRIGLGLDRSGFTVVDRDRSKGLYYVRYADPDVTAKREGSFLSKLAFWKSDDKAKPEQYRILVTDSGQNSLVSVQNPSGAPDRTPNAGKILALLRDELK